MLVPLADWCYRRRRLVVVSWIVALVGSFALAGAFGGDFKQNYLQPGSDSQAASDTLGGSFPEQGRGHRPGRRPRRDRGHDAGRAGAGGEDLHRPRRRRARRRRHQPVQRRGCHPGLCRRHHRLRRRRARQDGQRVHGRRGQGPGGTGSRRGRRCPAGRGRRRRSQRCRRPPRSGPRSSGWWPRPSSCWSRSGPRWRWGCRCSPPCSASVSPWASEASSCEWSTSRTGRRPWRRWSGIGVGIDYALLIVTRFRERPRRRAGPSARHR